MNNKYLTNAIFTDIWNGKVVSSGVSYNSSRKVISSDNATDIGDLENTIGKEGSFPLGILEEQVDSSERSQDDVNQDDGDRFLPKEGDVCHDGEQKSLIDAAGMGSMKITTALNNDYISRAQDFGDAYHFDSLVKSSDLAITKHPLFKGTDSGASLGSDRLQNDLNSSHAPSMEQFSQFETGYEQTGYGRVTFSSIEEAKRAESDCKSLLMACAAHAGTLLTLGNKQREHENLWNKGERERICQHEPSH